MFNLRDVLDMAIKIERNGESVYRKALMRTNDPELVEMLTWMADEEARHANYFSDIRQKLTADLGSSKSFIKFSKSRRVGFPWSALRAEFSRAENWRDGFPEARTAGGMKRKEMATKPNYKLMKDLGHLQPDRPNPGQSSLPGTKKKEFADQHASFAGRSKISSLIAGICIALSQ